MVELVKLHDGRPSLRDIPGRLRHLSDLIENGTCGDVKFAAVVVVRTDSSQSEFGYGDVNILEAIGAFSWAASHIGDSPIDSFNNKNS